MQNGCDVTVDKDEYKPVLADALVTDINNTATVLQQNNDVIIGLSVAVAVLGVVVIILAVFLSEAMKKGTKSVE